jgi:hypothetical protein
MCIYLDKVQASWHRTAHLAHRQIKIDLLLVEPCLHFIHLHN